MGNIKMVTNGYVIETVITEEDEMAHEVKSKKNVLEQTDRHSDYVQAEVCMVRVYDYGVFAVHNATLSAVSVSSMDHRNSGQDRGTVRVMEPIIPITAFRTRV